MRPQMSAPCLLDHFSALDDPRQAWKVAYPLPEILLIVLCATMAGAEDFVQIERWANRKLDFLRRFLPFAKGIPSHDTLNDVINALPAESFQACFTAWVETLRDTAADIVAIDGKTSRRSHNRARGRNPLHLVSAWAARQRLVLGQQACEEKSNEITAIPALLERLELTGALITIDAMGCQTRIARAIRDKGADYLLALKENWPALCAGVERFFADPEVDACERHDTFDRAHGRVETRRHAVCHRIDWLKSDRRFPGEWRFKDLAMIAMVEAERQPVFHPEHFWLQAQFQLFQVLRGGDDLGLRARHAGRDETFDIFVRIECDGVHGRLRDRNAVKTICPAPLFCNMKGVGRKSPTHRRSGRRRSGKNDRTRQAARAG